MENHEKAFLAYSRKLLRSLKKINELLNENKMDEAQNLLSELIKDTEEDAITEGYITQEQLDTFCTNLRKCGDTSVQ